MGNPNDSIRLSGWATLSDQLSKNAYSVWVRGKGETYMTRGIRLSNVVFEGVGLGCLRALGADTVIDVLRAVNCEKVEIDRIEDAMSKS
jgi:hypothetical protein